MNDLHTSSEQSTSDAAAVFRAVFDEEPDMVCLDQADLMVIRDTDMTPVAVVAVEKGLDGSWYCWLLAVSEAHRGKGLGSSLLQTVVRRAKEDGAVSVCLKTFQERVGMQTILRRKGWFLCGAELAGRFDGVREIWRLPLISSPMGILVIGANPEGRGGEWVKRIHTMPEMWALRGIVEPSESHRMYWGGIGVPSFSSMDDPGALQHVEAVVLAVPPTQVVALQRECMNRGLAILVEKPLASSLSELAELQDAVVSNPVPIIVGVQRRSHPSYVALIE